MSIFNYNSLKNFNLTIDALNDMRDKDLDNFYANAGGLSLRINGEYLDLYFTFSILHDEENLILKLESSKKELRFPDSWIDGNFYTYYIVEDCKVTLLEEDSLRDGVDALLEIFNRKNRHLGNYLYDTKIKGGDLYRVLRNAHLRFNRFTDGSPSRFDYRVDMKKLEECFKALRDIKDLEKKLEGMEISMGKSLWYGESTPSFGDGIFYKNGGTC